MVGLSLVYFLSKKIFSAFYSKQNVSGFLLFIIDDIRAEICRSSSFAHRQFSSIKPSRLHTDFLF